MAARDASGRGGTALAGALFAAFNADGMVERTVALARAWRPDLVVHEAFAASGAIAAAVVGVPAVLHACNLWDPVALSAATTTGHHLRPALARYGSPPPPAATIDIGPPSLVGPRTGWPVRATPSSGGGELPAWLTDPGGRPRVLVSRSTTHGAPGGDPTRAVLAAAPQVDAEFVLVRGRAPADPPPNVRVTGWIPVDRALRHAAAFVHHGGSGGLLQALAAGVPQLVVPGSADRRDNAELVARRGAGLAVGSRRITAEVLTRLVEDPALRLAAAEVAEEIAAMPDAASVVPRLEALAAGALTRERSDRQPTHRGLLDDLEAGNHPA